jgi:WD40 repeat protein
MSLVAIKQPSFKCVALPISPTNEICSSASSWLVAANNLFLIQAFETGNSIKITSKPVAAKTTSLAVANKGVWLVQDGKCQLTDWNFNNLISFGSNITNVAFKMDTCITLDSKGSLQMWDTEKGQPITQFNVSTDSLLAISRDIYSANSEGVQGHDARSLKATISINTNATSIDTNPNVPHTIISGSKRGILSIWDTRQTQKPLDTISAHSFTITSSKYHPLHDSLILTSSADATVALWDISTGSSSAHSNHSQVVSKSNDVHIDSVYDVAWGYPIDPTDSPTEDVTPGWNWLSVGWDGRCVVASVDEKVRMNIMGL